jgi:serine/threonine protein kinase
LPTRYAEVPLTAVLLSHTNHVTHVLKACHVLGWVLQTASALGYLHGHGYVHRDLKPSNLLLTHDYINLKLCDFGTAADLRTTMTNNRVCDMRGFECVVAF